ncbi:PREDICTED: cucumber peeling cupredoxin-like [Nelumbo nucifera]|nr:PREDICTED: cucumber peeling cupredoxin-like [Nelumbo nucifera]
MSVIVIAWSRSSHGLQYMVGDSPWTIPPNKEFYNDWSDHLFFQIGDVLVFEFQSELHNLMQISRREYENCSAENPFRAFWVDPAAIPLIEQRVYYFICSFANYCLLGQKVSVTVHHHSSVPPPLPPSSPPLQPPQPQPSLSPTLLPRPYPCAPQTLSCAGHSSPPSLVVDHSPGIPSSSSPMRMRNLVFVPCVLLSVGFPLLV